MEAIYDNLWECLGVIIAGCALFLTISQNRINQRHNRLSVQPYICDSFDTNITDEFFEFSLSLENAGIGPAQIQSFQLMKDGKPFPDSPIWANTIRDMVEPQLKAKSKFPVRIVQHGMLGSSNSLPAGAKHCLLVVRFLGAKPSDEHDLRNLFAPFDLTISYASIYGDRLTYDTRANKRSSPH